MSTDAPAQRCDVSGLQRSVRHVTNRNEDQPVVEAACEHGTGQLGDDMSVNLDHQTQTIVDVATDLDYHVDGQSVLTGTLSPDLLT